jgi:hypothetical protein
VPTRVTLIADYSRDSKTPWNETVPSLENLFFSRSRKMCLQVFVLSREEFNTTRISGVLGVKKDYTWTLRPEGINEKEACDTGRANLRYVHVQFGPHYYRNDL